MNLSHSFALDNAWRVLLKDMGINPSNILRRAKLPEDLFTREGVRLPANEYFRLWQSLEEEANDPELPITIGKFISVESFSPPIFAALCSPNFNKAIERIRQFKKLIGPMRLQVQENPSFTSVALEFIEIPQKPPKLLIAVELIFFVQLLRIATREKVVPLKVSSTYHFFPERAYRDFFGTHITLGKTNAILFSAPDAKRPFLTANEKMWEFFEPELRKRLSELNRTAKTTHRVQAALLELLPSGQASVKAVATALGVSTRTLQRRLKEEGTNFQDLLSENREKLARYYLKSSSMSSAEISFLLGFDEPNSFFRAFRSWTGETPEQVRAN